MTDVLIPYTRFQECQDRRRRIAAELTKRDALPAIVNGVKPAPIDEVTTPPPTAHAGH